MAAKTPPSIILFGYDSSPFTQKIRLTLRLLQLPYTFILVPSMMPRPILVESFNLTYRKIPVLAIGKDVYIDTSLIVEALNFYTTILLQSPPHPNRSVAREDKGRSFRPSVVYPSPRVRALSRVLSSHYTDRPLFRLTTGLIPPDVWRTRFGTDRAELIGHKLDPQKLGQKVSRNLAALDTFLSILEPMLASIETDEDASPKWLLDTSEPSAADVALYYQLDWGEKMSRGEGISSLTAGGTTDWTSPDVAKDRVNPGVGSRLVMSSVFNPERYPNLMEWFTRFGAYVDRLKLTETRIEMVEKGKMEDAIAKMISKSVGFEMPISLPTPHQHSPGVLDLHNGLTDGTTVRVAPDDTGRDNPTFGRLIALTAEEVVITPDSRVTSSFLTTAQRSQNWGLQRDKKRMTRGVRLHFPRVGFTVVPLPTPSATSQIKPKL